MTPERLKHIRDFWLQVCGPCDYGVLAAGCNCVDPQMDVRPVIMELVLEVERLREIEWMYEGLKK